MSRGTSTAIGLAAAVVAALALLVDNILDRAIDESPAWGRFLVLALVCLAVAAAVFLFLVPWAERSSGQANRAAQAAFVVGLVSLASVIVFWTALPFVLGAGAFALGRLGEARAESALERSEGPRRRDATQTEEDSGESAQAAGQRASQGWASQVMGGLAALACLVLFVATSITD